MAANNDDAVTTTTAPVEPKVSGISPLKRFLREVQAELKKTNWPTKNELTKFTAVVVLTIVIVAVYLFVADAAMQYIATTLFHITPSTPR